MKVVFLHPDLGIGGAERLVVDAGVALQSQGHSVHFITSHHDLNHSFEETKNGTLKVTVVGDWLPRSTCKRFCAAWAYLRMIYAAVYLIFSELQPDVVFCDQISVCIPVLKLKKMKVIFYCHFPDQLLTHRNNWLKWFYRMPLDYLEEVSVGFADVVLVNSSFTAGIFRHTFKRLCHMPLDVLYPSINYESLLKPLKGGNEIGIRTTATIIFLSLNRFERKKNLDLAIYALGKMNVLVPSSVSAKTLLIIAGGYDERIAENKEYFVELQDIAEKCGVSSQVSFLKSPSDSEKQMLFHSCTAVLYTPQNEHFGIVPIEAMLLSRPVIACRSGGPLETILDGETGFLCEPTAEAFAEKMKLLASDRSLSREIGTAGAEHVRRNFSYAAFTEKLKQTVEKCLSASWKISK